jgi:DNA-binding transcriptional LysR family regulator
MNIESYQEFIILAETRNFWEASERLFMNQSTLSKHIKALEDKLGVPLFIRTTRHVELTEYGQTLLPFAMKIVHTYYDSNAALKKAKEQLNGQITIGSIPDMDSYGITNLFLTFRNKVPQYSIRPVEDDPYNLINMLNDKQCDFILTREDKLTFENNFKNDKKISRIPFLRDYMVAAVPKNHPFSNKKELHLRDLKNESFCLLNENSMLYNFAFTKCAEAGFTPNVIFTSQRLSNILDMVSRGTGVALLMNYHTAMPGDNPDFIASLGYVTIPVSPILSTQISLCYLSGTALSPAAEAFVNFCTEAFSSQNFTDTTFSFRHKNT